MSKITDIFNGPAIRGQKKTLDLLIVRGERIVDALNPKDKAVILKSLRSAYADKVKKLYAGIDPEAPVPAAAPKKVVPAKKVAKKAPAKKAATKKPAKAEAGEDGAAELM